MYLRAMSLKSLVGRWLARRTVRLEAHKAAHPHDMQLKWFNRLVERGAATAFGRDHGLHPGMTLEAFREAVPVRDYEMLKPYVDRAVAGESDVLWPGQPLYFCKTSGTTS